MIKCAIVTGGTRGIGRHTSLALADCGFDVFATYRADHRAADELESQSEGRVRPVQVDGANIEEVQRFRSIVVGRGSPVILVNNAGGAEDGLLFEGGRQRIINMMNNNFMGTVNFTLTFLDDMIVHRAGNIVNLSSSAAQKVKPGNSAYGCSKVAIERFSKGLAREVARFNIFVNCLAPSFVETEMFRAFAGEKRRDILKDIPTRKIHTPEQVAQTIIDLVTRRINTTGSIVNIGNGEHIV